MPKRTLQEQLNARTNRDGECWLLTGSLTKNGYGLLYAGKSAEGKDLRYYAHRVAYEITYGAIPDGMHIDHLCRNRSCVRPGHLEAVPQGVNTARGLQGFALTGACRAQLHDMTNPANVINKSNGARQCRLCRLDARRKRAELTGHWS